MELDYSNNYEESLNGIQPSPDAANTQEENGSISHEMTVCSECGKTIPADANVCPSCGNPLVADVKPASSKATQFISNYKKYLFHPLVGAVFCLLAVISLIICAKKINNDDYRFYKQHRQECIELYNDVKATANSYGSGFFKSAYNGIANDYLDLIEKDEKEMRKYKRQAISWGCACMVFLAVGGGIFVMGRKNHGSD